jgi:hypothetical protein
MTDDRNRLDAAVSRAAAAAVESPPARSLDSFIARHGPTLGLLAFEQEQVRLAAARKKLDELTAALTVARQALELRTTTLARELEVLRLEMDARRDEWMEAVARHDAMAVVHQSQLVPLQNRLAELVTELNAPPQGWGANVKQWIPRADLPQGAIE